MKDFTSKLKLERLVFDKIDFCRKGFRNENAVEHEFGVEAGANDDNIYKVTLFVKSNKPDEFEAFVCLSGFFSFDEECSLDEEQKNKVIMTNAVSILMPYLRSELTIITAQPETEPIVLPPFNISEMLKEG